MCVGKFFHEQKQNQNTKYKIQKLTRKLVFSRSPRNSSKVTLTYSVQQNSRQQPLMTTDYQMDSIFPIGKRYVSITSQSPLYFCVDDAHFFEVARVDHIRKQYMMWECLDIRFDTWDYTCDCTMDAVWKPGAARKLVLVDFETAHVWFQPYQGRLVLKAR